MTSDIVFTVGGLSRALTVRRVARARAMKLSIDPRDGGVRLTLPRRASEATGRKWAEAQRGWIEAELARLPRGRPFVAGATIPFRGEEVLIDWAPGHPRTPALDDGRLLVGGPAEAVPRRVLAWMRREALRVLTAETQAMAAANGITVGRIGIGDPRTRWGSCSSLGDIRYAWRLILAPPGVLRSTVAHELAHRLHMDHSPAFRAAEARLLGESPGPARNWLRANGAALYWIGRD